MKPSEKAIEAAFRQEDRRHFKIYGEALEAAYAIDVDPLLAAKDAEILALKEVAHQDQDTIMDLNLILTRKEAENARLIELLRLEFRI